MKKFLLVFFSLLIIIACDNKNNTYKYVEVVDEGSLSGGKNIKEKEAEFFNAISDSIAYLKAFEKFCISKKVYKDMEEALGKGASLPIDFKLYNQKGKEISRSICFIDKELRETEINNRIFSLNNTVKESVEQIKKENQEAFLKNTSIDSAKIVELEKAFRIKKDEFSNNDKKWYIPKSAPRYTNSNGIYLYFQTEKGIPSNLRFRLQYYDEDWLFFSSLIFSIDGKAYEYTPNKTERDCGDGGYIWEWFDEQVSNSDKDLLNALANAKSAKIKLIGQQYHDIRIISQTQIKSIKSTLEIYKAMGGQY